MLYQKRRCVLGGSAFGLGDKLEAIATRFAGPKAPPQVFAWGDSKRIAFAYRASAAIALEFYPKPSCDIQYGDTT